MFFEKKYDWSQFSEQTHLVDVLDILGASKFKTIFYDFFLKKAAFLSKIY